MRTAFHLVGNPAATDTSGEVIWADFETRSEGQRTDALVKMRTLKVPLVVLGETWGATQTEIERWTGLATSELEQQFAALAEAQAQIRGRTTEA